VNDPPGSSAGSTHASLVTMLPSDSTTNRSLRVSPTPTK
jgi:hypothetical protein